MTAIRKTRKSWDEPGDAHFLTYSCYRRLQLLTRERTRLWVARTLDACRRSHDFALWAYVVMPEHVHVLLLPRAAKYEMRRILAAVKRPVSRAARRHLEQSNETAWLARLTVHYPNRSVFRFWQPGGGYDANICRERSVREVMEYIHANPVRRGLVATPEEWEWSSARYWAGWKDAPLIMDHPHD